MAMRRADWMFFSEAARTVQTYRELIGIDCCLLIYLSNGCCH